MKAKNLITAMALPLLFSCTQDEFMSEGNKQDVASLQNRVKVGKVAFTNEETAGTRFDYATAAWEDGDMFRLFLMDQWNAGGNASGDGEQENANLTHFMKQKTWNNMYSIVNNFATNIPFYFNDTEKAWENDDAIVEGNYFAVAPAKGNQTEILNGVKNRRDVWVYINPVQKFDVSKLSTTPGGNKGKMLDGVEENQFSLAYTQVYRNEKMVTEDNVLQLPVQMRPILANIDLAIKNTDEMPYAVEKIVMSRLDGSPMPTLAYVRPAGNTPEDFNVRQDNGLNLFEQQWAKMATQDNIEKFKARYPGFCGVTDEDADNAHAFPVGEATWQPKEAIPGWPAFAQPYIQDTYTDECGHTEIDSYWSIASWTRTAARSVVEYSYPGKDGFTPYGCKGEIAKPAYEYVLDFTNEEGKGYILNNGESFRAFFTLPHDMYLREYKIVVYGEQYDSARDRWNKGIIVPKASDNINPVESTEENDGEFTLQNIDPSSEASWLQANIYFDDFRVTRGREIQTASAADLLHHLEAYYGKAGNFSQDVNKNVLFYVTTMGDFKITNELVDYVQALYDRYAITGGSKSLIYFTNTTGADGKGQLVFPKDLTNDHAIDLFYYSKNVDILNEGTQVIEKPIIYNFNKSKEALYEALRASDWHKGVYNDGVDILDKFEPARADQMYGGIGHITNEGDLTIKTLIDAASDKFAILNGEDGVLTLERAAIVGGEQLGEAQVTVHNEGEMTMSESFIDGELRNAGTVNVIKGLSYVTTKCVNNNDCVGCPTGNAQFNVLKDATFYVPTFINGTMGEVLVEDGGTATFGGENSGRIVVKGNLYPDVVDIETNGELASWGNDLVNTIIGVIEVRDGELKYLDGTGYTSGNIVNEGVIYVIGNSHVLISSGNGIIDVTLAGNGYNDYEARSLSSDTYFRYCGAVGKSRLEEVISVSNQNNPLILQYPAIDINLEDIKWKTHVQHSLLSEWNVKKILVKGTAILELDGKWDLKDPADDDSNKLGARHDALRVEEPEDDAKAYGRIIVRNKATLTQARSMTAVINGKMFGENRSTINVEGENTKVTVNGAGEFDYAGECTGWIKGDITKWTQMW